MVLFRVLTSHPNIVFDIVFQVMSPFIIYFSETDFSWARMLFSSIGQNIISNDPRRIYLTGLSFY